MGSFGSVLRIRLLAGTLAWIVVTIAIAGWGLPGCFTGMSRSSFASGWKVISSSSPRIWRSIRTEKPISQAPFERPSPGPPQRRSVLADRSTGQQAGAEKRGVLRSRSLWDHVLLVPDDAPSDGVIHQHRVEGPGGLPLEMIERVVYPAERPEQPLRLIIAADASLIAEPVDRFRVCLRGRWERWASGWSSA